MKKNAEKTEARSKQIVAAALELFFEKGYEGTSIRMIQQKIGKKVAGFYYYFASKDAVFEAAINLFFEYYEAQMQAMVDSGRDNPNKLLTRYIDQLNKMTQQFRAQYLHQLHWSILGAIREHTLLVIKKYIREILEIYIEKGIIAVSIADIEIATNLLAFGIGGSILYQSQETYAAQQSELKQLLTSLLGISE